MMQPYKFEFKMAGKKAGIHIDYAISKAEVINDIKLICERYGTANNSIHYLDGTMDVHLRTESGWLTITGKATPLNRSMCRVDQLKQGDLFSYVGQVIQGLRVVIAIANGKVYAPTVEDSKEDLDEWKSGDVIDISTTSVFLYTEK